MNKVQIFFIYANNCEDCIKAKQIVDESISECKGIDCEIKMFNSEERVSVNMAIKHNIDDIPACIIGNGLFVFQSGGFNKEDIIKAINKASKVKG